MKIRDFAVAATALVAAVVLMVSCSQGGGMPMAEPDPEPAPPSDAERLMGVWEYREPYVTLVTTARAASS